MHQVVIQNLNRPESPLISAYYCTSFLCRLRGLTFRWHLPHGGGLLLVQKHDSRVNTSIHMLFMWIDLAVVWINTRGEVVDVKKARRWHPAYLPERPARYVLELADVHINDFKVGERVSIEILQT